MDKPVIAVLRSNPKDAALSRLVRSLGRISRVDCYLWDRQRDFQPAFTSDHVHYHKCGLRAGYYSIATLCKLVLFQGWLLCRLLLTRCDAIHAIDLDTGLPGWLAATLKRKPFIYHCLDPYYAILPDNWPKFLAKLARWLENRLISSADLFIITDLLRMPQHAGAKPRQVVEVANVPTLPNLAIQPADPGHFTVGYLGSLIEGRNLETVIEACGELEQEGIRLTIGSFGPLEERIEACARKWPNVVFRKWIPSYAMMLAEEAAFDLFVHITDPANESQKWVSPNKLFEAMAFGKPIIVAKETLSAKRVGAFGNGMAIRYGAKQELQKAILNLKNNPETAKEMGAKGRSEFQTNWRPELIEERLLEAYQRILGAAEV